MKYVSVYCIIAVLSVIGCAKDSEFAAVEPGEGAAGINLGESREMVISKLGEPVEAEPEQVADSLMRDEWAIDRQAIVSALFYEQKVVQIKIEGPAYMTSGGVSGFSSIDEIRKAYPDMEASVMAHDMDNMYLDDIDQGIAFSVRGAVGNEPANDNGDVINVFVHPPGKEVIAIVHHHDGHAH